MNESVETNYENDIDDYGPSTCCERGRIRYHGGSRYYCDWCGKYEIRPMKDLFKMKLHDVLTPKGPLDTQIMRVPGGWIYRFSQINQVVMPDGQWCENYLCDSVFVPLSPDCGSEESAVEHGQAG